MSETVLTQRALGRATLARQLLLERDCGLSAYEAVARLAGMQSQAPLDPYVGLWSRLRGFDPASLSALYRERRVARLALMRSTIHLVTDEDALAWRPLVEPFIVRATDHTFGRHFTGLDRAALTASARALTEEKPLSFAQLGAALAVHFPGRDAAALAQAARAHLPLVQVTPRGLWGGSGPIAHTTAEVWFSRAGAEASATNSVDAADAVHATDAATSADAADAAQPLSTADALDAMMLRYLAAFGPASVKDAQVWSGLTRLREVFERLRPELRSLRDPHGTDLFDLPDAPRPDPDTPAPVRFLPGYDNLLFGHADRTRVIPDPRRPPILPAGNGATSGPILVDGVWAAHWSVSAGQKSTGQRSTGRSHAPAPASTAAPRRLTVVQFEPLAPAARDEVEAEGRRLLAFLATPADGAGTAGQPAQSDPAAEVRFVLEGE